MEWQIEYIASEQIIYIKTRGILDALSANSMVKEIVAAASFYACNRQIVDHRETTFALSLFEYYERPDVNMKIGISHKWKIAMVFKELTQDTHFMETVFKNRGYNFREFDDLEEARAWVLSK